MSLDVNTYYRMRALSYENLYLRTPSSDHSFVSQNAQISVFVKDVQIQDPWGKESSMDVGAALRGVGVAGSSVPVSPPFDGIGSRYASTNLAPFLESAYVKLHQFLGRRLETTLGMQPYQLGGGLLLADDGVGLTGASARGPLPFWGVKAGGFLFQGRNAQSGGGDSLTLLGLSLELPTEGIWQLHHLIERDKAPQTAASGTPIQKANRSFTSLRYQLTHGPFVFDGEAAIQRGSAFPTGPTPGNPAGSKIAYNGNAQVLKAKWRQSLWRGGEGIARLVYSRGSGDKGDTPGTDEAFFPSRGHRFDGLERAGLGELFAATPYDGFGGRSSSTASGLPLHLSGVQTVGLGFTPAAYYGIAFDFDYYLFQADRGNLGPHRTLGTETDLRLRYMARDHLTIAASAAFFQAGAALSETKPKARRLMFEVSGRF